MGHRSSNHVVVVHMSVFVFFQAEDGIRDIGVTGVQTCALPILPGEVVVIDRAGLHSLQALAPERGGAFCIFEFFYLARPRSEERRVGKECRSRWSPYH